MAITPKSIIGAAVDLGPGAANLLRKPRAVVRSGPSGSPTTVGAPKPGQPRGVKSATAPKTPRATKAEPAAPRKKEATSKTQEV
jgi:hypothetical protein